MSRGFARGFDVGFNAVDSVIRQRDEKEERERRNKREDEKWSFERDRMERERSKAAELAAAGQAPAQGMAVGQQGAKNFAAGEADQKFLAEQEAAMAELEGRAARPAELAAGAGNQIMGRDDPRAQDGRQGYLARVADVQRRHGDVAGSLTTEEIGKRIEKEGYKDTIDYILAGGDPKKAQKMFNSSGRVKIDGELIATPTKRVGANGVEVPDMNLAIRDANGNVRQLGSALQMRFMADNPAEYMKLLNQEQEGALRARGVANQEKATEASIRQNDRRLDLTAMQVNDQLANSAFTRGNQAARFAMDREKWDDEKNGGKLKREIEQAESLLGRKLTPTERLGKLGFKAGDDETGKLVNKLTEEWQKGNPEATPAQIAEFKADLARQIGAAPAMLEVEARVKALPPEQRAAAMAEAQQRFGLTPEWFKERGIEAPAAGPQGSPTLDSVIAAGKKLLGNITGGGEKAGPAAQQAPRPAQMATTPDQVPTMYRNAIAGLRSAQQDLARKMQGATPEQQAELNAQIMALGAQIAKQIEAAKARGVVVE